MLGKSKFAARKNKSFHKEQHMQHILKQAIKKACAARLQWWDSLSMKEASASVADSLDSTFLLIEGMIISKCHISLTNHSTHDNVGRPRPVTLLDQTKTINKQPGAAKQQAAMQCMQSVQQCKVLDCNRYAQFDDAEGRVLFKDHF